MKCPVDQTTLVMAERHGVEIDYCPTCRGIWLDRGELDKIIAQVEAPAAPPVTLREPAPQQPPRRADPEDRDDRRRRYDDDDDRDGDRRYRKRREGFLSDLFDF